MADSPFRRMVRKLNGAPAISCAFDRRGRFLSNRSPPSPFPQENRNPQKLQRQHPSFHQASSWHFPLPPHGHNPSRAWQAVWWLTLFPSIDERSASIR